MGSVSEGKEKAAPPERAATGIKRHLQQQTSQLGRQTSEEEDLDTSEYGFQKARAASGALSGGDSLRSNTRTTSAPSQGLGAVKLGKEPWRPQSGPEFIDEFRRCYVRLTVFPCDDKDHPGTEIYVRKNHERAYDDLLDVLNKTVPPTTGPAVCVYDQVLSCCTSMDELHDDEFYVVSAGAIPQWESLPRRFRKRMPLFLAAVDQRHVPIPTVPPKPEKFRPVDWIAHVSPKSTNAQLMHLETKKRLNEARFGRALVNRRSVGRSLPRKHLKGDTIDASTMLTPGLSKSVTNF